MYKKKKIIAVVPARGGSKAITGKNIKEIAGKPLIAWTLEEAKRSIYIDRTVVSSDSMEILTVAKKYGGDIPFVRPSAYAKDDTPGVVPILHALQNIKELYDYVIVLQPTSPLRIASDIDGAIQFCVENNCPAVVSVVEVDKSPFWMYFVGDNGQMSRVLDVNQPVYQRQLLPQIFIPNGAVYIASVSWFLSTEKFITSETRSYVMSKENSIDIDDSYDWGIAEMMMQKRLKG